MIAMLANIGMLAGALLLLALPAVFKPRTRPWLFVLVAFMLINAGVNYLPIVFHGASPIFPSSHWNWSGKVFGVAVGVMVSLILIATRAFKGRELGLSLLQAPGTARAFLFGVVPFLVLLAGATALWFANKAAPSWDTVWFQATMPGLAEELSYRGVLLALLDRMFPARFRFAGAELGYGAIVTSLIFGLGHGVAFGEHLNIHAALVPGISAGLIGFFLAWLRLRTRSLVLPVLTHNAINVIFESVPRLL